MCEVGMVSNFPTFYMGTCRNFRIFYLIREKTSKKISANLDEIGTRTKRTCFKCAIGPYSVHKTKGIAFTCRAHALFNFNTKFFNENQQKLVLL